MEASPKGQFCPSGYIIYIIFPPFTGFTFFNQAPYSSVIQGEGVLRISGYRAHRPYARCSPPVCPVVTIRMPGTWEAFAQRPESDSSPSPCITDEQGSEAKKVKPVKGVKNMQK
ncbi:hypothetical protein [Bacteroides salyersiae]|uniref:hypothetical protein n=1 Tax=Bacteroides salyersiae TaxID=291644 RepID=UPI001C8C28A1|nr:hypothetical protein [Bacteroides salyersiae]